MMRDSPHETDPAELDAGGSWLHVAAANHVVALHFDLIEEVVDPGPVVRVPGAAAWCLGLVSVGGQLLTLVDAGLLFSDRPSQHRAVVVLTGLAVKTALAVDENLLTHGDDAHADVRIEAQALADHPAFQPGAALATNSPRAEGATCHGAPWGTSPASQESAR